MTVGGPGVVVGAGGGVTCVAGAMNSPKPTGNVPTGTVAVTVLVPVPITDTVLDMAFATYTLVPSGVTPTPIGWVPTGTVVMTVLVPVLITDTELLVEFAT